MTGFELLLVGLGIAAVAWLAYRMNRTGSTPTASTTVTPLPISITSVSAVPTAVDVAPVSKGPAPCGCGRSPTGYCQGLHSLSESEWAVHDLNPNKVEAKVEEPATKKAAAKRKPAAKKATTKKAADKAAK